MKNDTHRSAYVLYSHIFIGWIACMAILVQYVANL